VELYLYSPSVPSWLVQNTMTFFIDRSSLSEQLLAEMLSAH